MHEFEAHVNPELMQSVLEVATPVCRTAGDGRGRCGSSAYVTGIAHEKGLRVGSQARIRSASSSVSASPRATATTTSSTSFSTSRGASWIFGLHVHVAVSDPDTAIQVVNGLLAPPVPAPRPLRQLTLLAWRADRT